MFGVIRRPPSTPAGSAVLRTMGMIQARKGLVLLLRNPPEVAEARGVTHRACWECPASRAIDLCRIDNLPKRVDGLI